MKIILYRNFNTIFYCQDKNASTSLEKFFNSKSKLEPLIYFDNSCRYPSSDNLKLEIFNSKKQVFQFTVVRNTWDRMVSLYAMLQKQVSNKKLHPWFKKFENELVIIYEKENSFENFIKYICSFQPTTADSHWQDQYIHLPFSDKNFYIARFENLDNELKYIYRKMEIPYKKLQQSNNSTIESRPNYRTFYNQNTKKLIKQRYRKEIGIFGFKF